MQAPSSASETPLYNTAAVVQRTGVPATTIRAWERRYGYPLPRRDTGGQRLYSEREIEGIRWLADQTAHGVAISRAVAMLRGGHAVPGRSEAAATQAPRSFASVRSDMLNALLALELDRAEAVLAEAFALYSVEDVCLNVFEPLLVEVGDRWNAGELSIAEEHYITGFVRARLFALLDAYQRAGAAGPLVLLACAPEEWHELGILLVSVFLARRGAAARYLGPNLPLDALKSLVEQHHPAVVALSAQSRETARKLREAAPLLAEGPPPHPQLVFGGQAFNNDPALREGMQATYVGPSAAAAAQAIASMVDRSNGAAGPGVRSARRRRG
ncbi:MAG: B12-binding domain-containing protein [Chloroflexi bacterium]|nr:B12-binding domain-containing protein [Chloroflexota bacterium]